MRFEDTLREREPKGAGYRKVRGYDTIELRDTERDAIADALATLRTAWESDVLKDANEELHDHVGATFARLDDSILSNTEGLDAGVTLENPTPVGDSE